MAGLIVALDTADAEQAARWAEAVAPHCGVLKLGLQFVLARGPAGARGITPRPVFLDLKLHDIPNTVAGAVEAVLPLRPAMLTVHAGGGGAMLAAARRAADTADQPPMLLAVTVLALGTPPASPVARASRCCGWPAWRWRPARTGWCAARRKHPC